MELLKKLADQIAPSGNEKPVRDIIMDEVKPYADETTIDALGNLIVRKKGNGKKIMLSAHMDEVGIIATVIDDANFIRFSNIGGVKLSALQYSKVKFTNGTTGVVASNSDITPEKSNIIDNYYIDRVDNCKVYTLNSISVGDVAVFAPNFEYNNGIISSKSLDDRVGCYILIETLKQLKNTDNDLYFVFTVQEELGLRGAKTAANNIMPDYGIAVDVTICDDIPKGGKYPLKLGEGPAIKVKDGSIMCHPYIKQLLENSAKETDSKYQFEVLDKGGTDAGAIHLTGVGVVTGAMSIPIRYLHTSCEIAHENDIKTCIKILTKACEGSFK